MLTMPKAHATGISLPKHQCPRRKVGEIQRRETCNSDVPGNRRLGRSILERNISVTNVKSLFIPQTWAQSLGFDLVRYLWGAYSG